MVEKTEGLTHESFERLLSWLNSDRELAGRTYEQIRSRLVKILTCRGCNDAEDVADATIDRVSRKLSEIVDEYEGDPALYFYGVARNVLHEHLRQRPKITLVLPLPEAPIPESIYQCFEQCLQKLPPKDRAFVLRYYTGEKHQKIKARHRLAERLRVSSSALRLRAYRIRALLRKCLQECLAAPPLLETY